ncbi:Solute carrier family 35 member F1 [Nymphaea thermarum]|nr:Solute carrier family 35 member F1 [Nymphaea thermarum]
MAGKDGGYVGRSRVVMEDGGGGGGGDGRGGGGCMKKTILWFRERMTLVAVILGQMVAFLNASTAISSTELVKRGINAPTSQSFLNYALLAIVYGSVVLLRKKGLRAKWYYYILLALVDVEANFLVVKAYQYTSMTSVMLLLCWSIPSVIILTWLFLKTRYRFIQFFGVAVCIGGLVVIVFSDVHGGGDRTRGPNPLKGDLIVVAGATLYAVSNEFLVKNVDRIEVMAMLGVFGAIVGACQIAILERQELKSINWTVGAVMPFIGFSLALFLFYSLVPILLKISGSTMLNLSLLTADAWSVLIRIFVYHQKCST